MNRLEEIIENRRLAQDKENPMSGQAVRARRKRNRRNRNIIIATAVIIVVIGFIYLPQAFIRDKETKVTFPIKPDAQAIAYGEYAAKNAQGEDFDGDGLINSQEEIMNTDPWNQDTDGDGWTDGQEALNNTNPRVADKSFITAYLKAIRVDSYQEAYKIDDITLWADGNQSRVYGSVMKYMDGSYYFNEFRGYAKFPQDGYAYRYENGIHTLLKKDKQGRWEIDRNEFVTVYAEKLDTTNRFTVFGKSSYIKSNGLTDFIEKLLPDKGFITMQSIVKQDLDIGLEDEIRATNKRENIVMDKTRFDKNDISLDDIALLKNYIDNGDAVPVSFYNSDNGELIAYINGYNSEGDFYIISSSGKELGRMSVFPIRVNMLDNNGLPVSWTYYKWKAAGFDSENGDRISYLYTKFFG